MRRNLRTNILFQMEFSSLLLGRAEGGLQPGNPLSWPVMLLKTPWRVFSGETWSHSFQCDSEAVAPRGGCMSQRLALCTERWGTNVFANSIFNLREWFSFSSPDWAYQEKGQGHQKKHTNHGVRIGAPRAPLCSPFPSSMPPPPPKPLTSLVSSLSHSNDIACPAFLKGYGFHARCLHESTLYASQINVRD